MPSPPSAAEQAPPPLGADQASAGMPPEDRIAANPVKPEAPEEPWLFWHDSWLILENTVTAQTIGIGRSFQSSNPTYDVALSLRPRFYFYDTDADSIYLSGRVDVTREFTNNDVTTEQGETIIGGAPHGLGAADPTLFTAYRHVLAKRGGYQTLFVGNAPVLTFPLSKFSFDNGTYLGLGADARFYQEVPLAGSRSAAFRKLTIGAIVAYNHTFTRATTPSDLQLFRVRMDPEGKSLPGDQLTGAAFPEHEMRLAARFVVEVAKDLTWWTDFGYDPTWLYPIQPVDIRILTGSAPPIGIANPNTYVVVTHVDSSINYDVLSELTVGLGYNNTEVQPGLDGQRRNIFYSPNAAFYLELIGHLDEMYLTATGRRTDMSAKSRRWR